jgi:hypothetical protein
MTPRAQLALPLALPAHRPLVPVEVAVVILDRDYDEVVSLIEEGKLMPAWNIASPGCERREIRIAREGLLRMINGQGESLKAEEMLPHHRDTLRTTELQRFFSASQWHVQGLCNAGELEVEGERAVVRGPNAFSRVTRTSVLNFLNRRTI